MSDDIIEKIKCFVFDVDGVLTDGMVIALESGEQARRFNIKDGFAIERALLAGFEVAIISGGNQEGVRKRLEFLKIQHIYLGVKDKVEELNNLCKKIGVKHHEILYVGDDMPDYDVMKEVGYPCCPADAVQYIKGISKHITDAKGGEGCVREVIELVMLKQGKWKRNANETINN